LLFTSKQQPSQMWLQGQSFGWYRRVNRSVTGFDSYSHRSSMFTSSWKRQ